VRLFSRVTLSAVDFHFFPLHLYELVSDPGWSSERYIDGPGVRKSSKTRCWIFGGNFCSFAPSVRKGMRAFIPPLRLLSGGWRWEAKATYKGHRHSHRYTILFNQRLFYSMLFLFALLSLSLDDGPLTMTRAFYTH